MAERLIIQLGQRMQIGAAIDDPARNVLNVARLAEGDANALQLIQRTRRDNIGCHPGKPGLHLAPEGNLGLGGNLLTNDAVHQRMKEIRLHLASDQPDAVDGRGQTRIPGAQVV